VDEQMAAAALAVVAAANVQTLPEPDKVSPGFAGFLAIFVLAVATVFLLRSMVKHLRKVRYSPDPADPNYRADQDWPRIGLPPTAAMAERSGDADADAAVKSPGGPGRARDVVHDRGVDTGR
jgi:hypothetical protein